jgi:hypothetical protein
LLALGHRQQSVNGLVQRRRQALKHRLEQLGMHVGTQGDDEPFQDGGTGQKDALRSQIVFGLLKQGLGQQPLSGVLLQPGGELGVGRVVKPLKAQVRQNMLAMLCIRGFTVRDFERQGRR